MTHSPYTNGFTMSPNHYNGRAYGKPTRITPHHMAGNLSAQRCAELFLSPGRQASCNYCIGTDGQVVMSVDEDNAPWTSSSYDNDNRAITFEIANDGGPDWHVSDAALQKFIDMSIDIVKRYNMGTMVPGKNLTWHRMFSATSCPGEYLLGNMQYIADRINAGVSGGSVQNPAPAPTPEPSQGKGNSKYQVHTVGGSWLPQVSGFHGNQDDDGSAGIFGRNIDGLACDAPEYRVHTMGGSWLPAVCNYNINDAEYGMAGIYSRAIDGVAIRGKAYRVHCVGKGWLDWVNQYNVNDWNKGCAGWPGWPIDAIQIE